MSLRIYRVKEYDNDNDILVHDYILCKRYDPTGVYYEITGVYDLIDGVFYNVCEFIEIMLKRYKNATWTWE